MEVLTIPLESRAQLARRRKLDASATNGSDDSISASIDLSNYYNNEYVGVVYVGTPAQELTVIFDTGSSDIWLPQSTCKSCGFHASYNPTLSTTYAESSPDGSVKSSPFVIYYGSGTVSGTTAWESFALRSSYSSDSSADSLCVNDLQFGLASKESSSISKYDMDGIAGLAFPALAAVTRPTLLENLFDQYPRMSRSFSLYLSSQPDTVRDRTSTHTTTNSLVANADEMSQTYSEELQRGESSSSLSSRLIFGGYDLSIVSKTAVLHYTPLIRTGRLQRHWSVALTGFHVGKIVGTGSKGNQRTSIHDGKSDRDVRRSSTIGMETEGTRGATQRETAPNSGPASEYQLEGAYTGKHDHWSQIYENSGPRSHEQDDVAYDYYYYYYYATSYEGHVDDERGNIDDFYSDQSQSDWSDKFVYSLCTGSTSCMAIVDSGTSGIAVPTEYYSGLVNYITTGLDCVELDCVNVSPDSFPMLYVALAPDNIFPLLPSDYTECTPYHRCSLRFQQSDRLWILGTLFIQAYYTHFDVENLRVGFACESAGECAGGSWQNGTGGYYMDVDELPLWRRALFVYCVFGLIVLALWFLFNWAWRWNASRQEAGVSLGGTHEWQKKSALHNITPHSYVGYAREEGKGQQGMQMGGDWSKSSATDHNVGSMQGSSVAEATPLLPSDAQDLYQY